MRLIITRHGETEENKAGIIQGQTVQGTLSEEGKIQAKKLALRLKDEKIDYVYSSNLGRAADTAKEIMKYHKNTPIEFTVAIRERHFGEFENKFKEEIGWDKPPAESRLIEQKEGESKSLLFERAKSFLHCLLKKHNNETVLLVAHSGVNKAFLAVIMGKSIDEIVKVISQKNTAVTIIDIDEDKNYKIHVMNCVKHLEE